MGTIGAGTGKPANVLHALMVVAHFVGDASCHFWGRQGMLLPCTAIRMLCAIARLWYDAQLLDQPLKWTVAASE